MSMTRISLSLAAAGLMSASLAQAGASEAAEEAKTATVDAARKTGVAAKEAASAVGQAAKTAASVVPSRDDRESPTHLSYRAPHAVGAAWAAHN